MATATIPHPKGGHMAKGRGAPRGPLSMADRDGWIWMDGKLVPWRDATTHVLTHSLHYGLAVFEGVRAYKTAIGTAIYRLKEHTDRLFNSAHIYMMKIPYTREELMQAQLEVVRANEHEACYIRPIAFYGSEKMGVSPIRAKAHAAIAAWPSGAYLGPEALEKGIPVNTSSYPLHHSNHHIRTLGVLDGHRRRGDADPRARRPHHRRGQSRPGNEGEPERLLRRCDRQGQEAPPLSHAGGREQKMSVNETAREIEVTQREL